jgi:hypothetical protein
MEDKVIQLIDEAIELENNVSDIYQLFALTYKEDKDFWWKIVIEEKNHAALLRSGKESYIPANLFPQNILPETINEITAVNKKLRNFIENYQQSKPTRNQTFNIAYHLENSAGEIHYQKFMEKDPETKIEHVFMQLNQDDKDHAQRIDEYMKKNNISHNKENLPDFLK